MVGLVLVLTRVNDLAEPLLKPLLNEFSENEKPAETG